MQAGIYPQIKKDIQWKNKAKQKNVSLYCGSTSEHRMGINAHPTILQVWGWISKETLMAHRWCGNNSIYK